MTLPMDVQHQRRVRVIGERTISCADGLLQPRVVSIVVQRSDSSRPGGVLASSRSIASAVEAGQATVE